MGYVGWQLAANPLRYYWKRSVSHISMCHNCIVFSTINFAMGKVGGFLIVMVVSARGSLSVSKGLGRADLR